jgi:hypothetical protein
MKPCIAALTLFGLVASAVPADAQYYAPPPPAYASPPYYAPPPVIGRHCEAFVPTQYGPRRLACRIIDPKPVGRPCACPPPPGYPPEPFIGGRTIR